jgi:hypothetical protein
MSQYKRITTKIADRELLIKALEALDIPFEQGEAVELHGHFAHGRTAQIVVRKVASDRYAEDLGFVWDETSGTYQAVLTDYVTQARQKLNQIKQQYAIEGVNQKALREGYTVTQEQQEDGTVRLLLRRY